MEQSLEDRLHTEIALNYEKFNANTEFRKQIWIFQYILFLDNYI